MDRSVSNAVSLWRALTAAAVCTWSVPAWATDMPAAESLFNEGRRLFDAGQIDEACQKFGESQRLDPSPGTLLNLARCHETQGKTASAWAEYLAAKRAATAASRSQIAATAAARADALKPLLAYLTIDVTAPVEGLQVARNGVQLEPAALRAALPVDPGTHRVTATAPGYEPWSGDVTMEKQQTQRIEIPALVKTAEEPAQPGSSAPAAPAPAERPAPPDPLRSTRPAPSPPTLAYVLSGVGAATLGTGLVFGLVARSQYHDALDQCPTRAGCSEDALSRRDAAGTSASVANIAIPVGLAALTAGVVLLVTHQPGSHERQAAAVPAARFATASTRWEGRF